MSSRHLRYAAVFAACAALGSLAPAVSAQSPAAINDTARALSIEFVNGQKTTYPLRQTGGMWTPTFPKIPGADTSKDGIPLTTLDVRYVADNRDLVATISVMYGGALKPPVKVATVRVTPGSAVQVPELRAYGIEPITLSIIAIPRTVAYRPETFSVSAQLEVQAEPVGPNTAAYRVVLKNHSDVPLMWVALKAYRGDQQSLSGRPRGKRNLPLVPANSEYTTEMPAGANGRGNPEGPEAWQPFDRIGVTSLMWQDGLVEGEAALAEQQRRFDEGRAANLRTLLAVLGGARDLPLPQLKTEIGRTMGFDVETKAARDEIVADVEALERTARSRSGQDFSTWLTHITADYQQWLARIVFPKS